MAGETLQRQAIRLIHIIIQQKPTQGCKAIILQLKKKRKDKTRELGEVKCHSADSPAGRAQPEAVLTLKTLHLHQGGEASSYCSGPLLFTDASPGPCP